MMALKKDFPDLSEYKLERNYRSTQAILDAATQVISQTTAHPVLSLWTDQPSGSKITVYEANDRRDEAYWTIKQIDLLREKLSLNEIAILYRTNAQSRSFEEALVKAAIPYKVIGGQKFYERKEIKDLLSFLRLIINPTDRVSLERMNKSGKRRLAALLSWIEIAGNNNLISQPPVDLLHKIIEITGYTNKLSAKDPDDLSRLENIDELLRVAKQFTTITNFLENVALVQNDSMPDKNDISQTTNQNEWVSLMSLHAAKGLEFSAVFLAGLEEGMLPHSRSQWDMEQLEEERRLMYVGLTRAKRNLFLTFAKQKDFGGGYNMRSRFINDIDKSLLQQIGQSGSSWSGNKSTSTWQSAPTVKATDVKRRLILDDDQLDALLDGDLNISEYVNR